MTSGTFMTDTALNVLSAESTAGAVVCLVRLGQQVYQIENAGSGLSDPPLLLKQGEMRSSDTVDCDEACKDYE